MLHIRPAHLKHTHEKIEMVATHAQASRTRCIVSPFVLLSRCRLDAEVVVGADDNQVVGGHYFAFELSTKRLG